MAKRAAISIEDLRVLAKRRLPRIVFDYLEGGVESELGLVRNRQAFAEKRLLPRRLVDVSAVDQSTTLFGKTYSSPFGIAPMGSDGLFRPGADRMFAQVAASANIPFLVSSLSTSSLESEAELAKGRLWLQMYAARGPEVYEGFIARALAAGIETIAVTVDVPKHAKRERDIRNGFVLPRRFTRSAILEAMTHPAWIWTYFRNGGMPIFENWRPFAPEGADAGAVAKFVSSQIPRPVSWADLEAIRRLWPHNMVVKGIMRADDARRVRDAGANGVIVSNHGARQIDGAVASIDALPAVVEAVGNDLVVMLDSGIRRGSDIMTALCLGARFVFVGRAALYGAAATGLPGAEAAIRILREELQGTMVQAGCPDVAAMTRDLLFAQG